MNNLITAFEKAIVKHRRKSLSRAIFARYKGVVQYGAFKGMRFHGSPNVSQAAYGLKIFGLYESEIANQLISWSPADVLIDIGAGDGYYPIGMLKANMIHSAICFEATESGRKEIERNADLNGVGDQIRIFGKANSDILNVLKGLNINPKETLVLCDIEGGEFDIIKTPLVDYLSGAKFIIELHDGLILGDNSSLREKLLSEFPDTYATRIIKDSPRNWNGIPELEMMHDLDRALVSSEGRKLIGEWLMAEMRT